MVRDNGWQYEKLDAALNTSIFPLPHIGLSVVPVSMSFEAVVVRAFLISLNVAAGFFVVTMQYNLPQLAQPY